MDSIYVLALENDKYFVIHTTSRVNVSYPRVYLPDSYTMTDVVEFFENSAFSLSDKGTDESLIEEWLHLHRPIAVISKLPGDNEEFLHQFAEWVRKKGFENVVGYFPTMLRLLRVR